ncbi:hypothetical protein HDU96_004137, partial [Phlyctochytrium bullatum]
MPPKRRTLNITTLSKLPRKQLAEALLQSIGIIRDYSGKLKAFLNAIKSHQQAYDIDLAAFKREVEHITAASHPSKDVVEEDISQRKEEETISMEDVEEEKDELEEDEGGAKDDEI